jgi:outer membrane lipoprotein-sorting protein
MKINTQIALAGLHVLVFLGMGSTVAAQMSSAVAMETRSGLTAEQIVQNMVRKNLERARALEAYSGTRVYRLEYHGFPSSRSAEITVDVQYRSPATKEFNIRSESGSHFLVEKVFQRMLQSEKEALLDDNQTRVALNNDNYRFTLAGQESLPSGLSYVLLVEPRTNNKLLYRGRIWVDAEDFAVVRIEAAPAKNPSFWTKETKIEQAYAKVGNFWLPVSNRSTSTIRLGGHAYFTIDYRDYKITAEAPLSSSSKVKGY